jgi:hypothetical protein
LKELKNSLAAIIILMSYWASAQNDPAPYTLFKDKIVLYTDLGYTSAPFSIHYNFLESIDKLKFKNNYRTVLGFGGSYKWFAMRIAFPLPGNMRSVGRYGNTVHYDLGVDFTIKKTFCDIDIRNYQGYAIKNANQWNDTLNKLNPNDIRKNTNALSFSANVWYFHDKNFKMTALKGKTGYYNREVKTWYLKNSLSIFGVRNGTSSLVPTELIDSTNSKTGSNSLSSIDFAFIPGYAYVNKIKNWQFSLIGGIGAAIQLKSYALNDANRGFLGLAPRYDIKFIGGYTVPKYFVFLVTDFDNKSIRFTDFVYRQSFYSIKIVGGFRFDTKAQREENKKSIKKRFF